MHKRSIRFSILIVILALFVGFGVSFVAPKPVRADELGDFVARLTLGDFIRGLFEGLFGGTRGADDPYVCEFSSLADCTGNCSGSCTSDDCSGGTFRCVPRPTATTVPAPGCSTNGSWRCSGSNRQQCVDFKWVTQSTCACASACSASSSYCNNTLCAAPTSTPTPRPPTATPTAATGNCSTVGELRCNGGQRQKCIIEFPTSIKKWVKVSNCDLGCSDAFPRCVGSSLNYCSSTDEYSCCVGNPQSTSCSAGCSNNKCNPTSTPTATSTVRPTATSVPLPPTVTVGPGTPSPTPRPTNTPVPYPTEPPGPPVATATPTTIVGAPCYYNVKLVSKDSGTALPSALQTGVTEAGGCRTQGVRELVPSFYSQPSTAINISGWPCTDATYVGESCTQGIVTGQFICTGGPSHEIKGCYNRTSDAYQRVSIVTLTPTPPAGATSTPTSPPVATPTPAYTSFPAWFTVFRSYIDGPAGGMSVSLTLLEDWRNNTP